MGLKRGDVTAIASHLGRSRSFVSRVLAGKCACSIDVAVRLAQALRDVCDVDVSVEELLRPSEPWPDDLRFLASDPPIGSRAGRWLTDERMARREARERGIALPDADEDAA